MSEAHTTADANQDDAGTVNDQESRKVQGTQQARGNQPASGARPTAPAAPGLSDTERARIAALPYEQARDQLIQAVQALEAGGLDLDASMRQWEIGEALAKRAQQLLGEVRAKLDAAQAEQSNAGASAGTQSNLER